MKRLILIVLILNIFGCAVPDNNTDIIDKFVENVIIKSDYGKYELYADQLSDLMQKENITNGKKKLDSIIKNAIISGESKEKIEDYIANYKNISYSNDVVKLEKQINQVIFNNASHDFLENHIEIYNVTKKDSLVILKSIGFNIIGLKEALKTINYKKHKVIHYSEAENHSEIKNSDVYQKLEYDNLENVYYTIFYGNEPYVIFFIIKNGKIISFFGNGIRTSKNEPIIPYLLNEKHDI